MPLTATVVMSLGLLTPECPRLYTAQISFDAAVLNHSANKIDGMEIAKRMLVANQWQKIIFTLA